MPHSDRISLQDFQVFIHGNGIQLVREGRTYSLIPILKSGSVPHKARVKWEVNDYQNTAGQTVTKFQDIMTAIKAIHSEEDLAVSKYEVGDFYDNIVGDSV